jgi:hypothetical protein
MEATPTEGHTLAGEVKKQKEVQRTDIGAQLVKCQGKLWQLLSKYVQY